MTYHVFRLRYAKLRVPGKAYFTLYSQMLEKFPLKGFYGWTEALGLEVVPLHSFMSNARRAGFSAELFEQGRQEVFSMVELAK